MATLAQLEASIATAIEALSGTLTRCGSDMRTNLEALAANAVKYQLRKDHLTKLEGSSSNVAWEVASFTVLIHHELNSPTAERTYTSGVMITHQKSLMDPAWWRAIAGVYGVVEGPTLQSEAERVGNTISYSMAVSLSFTGT
jgi:hypothetical protein